jgi:hypothetical protein
MNQATARIPNVVTETLVVDHGETDTIADAGAEH